MKNFPEESVVMVTGGAGFIGSNFIRMLISGELAGVPVNVVNLDKLTYAGNLRNLEEVAGYDEYEFVKADIGDYDAVTAAIQKCKPDAIVNFAAESHVDRSIESPESFAQTNVVGTLCLLEASLSYWREKINVSNAGFRFLHVSTDEVYGSLSSDAPAFTEENPFEPNSPYAASKASSDHFVRAYHHTYGLPVVTTNCSNNYGPFQFPEKLIPLMISNAIEGKPLPIYGDGKNVRDWLYVNDHCRAIWKALTKGTIGETYNVGGNCERMNIEIVDILCAHLDDVLPRSDGSSYREQKAFVKDRPGHDLRYAVDCTKIERELGWAPRETFETGIRKTVDWYLGNRDWCDEINRATYQRERLGLLK